jgi:hypothetical protein
MIMRPQWSKFLFHKVLAKMLQKGSYNQQDMKNTGKKRMNRRN